MDGLRRLHQLMLMTSIKVFWLILPKLRTLQQRFHSCVPAWTVSFPTFRDLVIACISLRSLIPYTLFSSLPYHISQLLSYTMALTRQTISLRTVQQDHLDDDEFPTVEIILKAIQGHKTIEQTCNGASEEHPHFMPPKSQGRDLRPEL